MKYCDKCRSSYPTEFNVCPIDDSVLRLTSELSQGMTIRDKYLILDKLGEGGMGVVYRARHLAFNEIRALKVVHSALAENPAFLRRFKTEAIIARKLQHPNAVRIDDLDSTEDGRPYIVMEFVAGSDLRTTIEKNGALPVERAVKVAIQVTNALSAAHKLGIVHRDIKPDNILLARGQNDGDMVKVADFGIAKVMEGTLDVGSGCASTKSGIIVGTPQFLSPEQAMGNQGSQIDGRADLYSLGIVLYMMLTGQLPFESDTPMGFLVHHLQTQPVPPDILRPDLDIPPLVSQVLMKSLEKDREKRFADADEMKEALHLILETPRDRRAPRARMAAAPAQPVPSQQVAEPATTIDQPIEKSPISGKEPIESRRPLAPWIAIGGLLLFAGVFAAVRYRGILGGKSGSQTLNTQTQTSAVVTVATKPSAAAPAGIDQLHQPGQNVRLPSGPEIAVRALPANGKTRVGNAPAGGGSGSRLAELRRTKPQSQNNASTTAVEHLTRGNQMMQQKQWNDAVSEFRAVIQLLPNNATAHNNLGIALEMSKAGRRAAMEEYRKAYELDPGNSAAKANYDRLRTALAR